MGKAIHYCFRCSVLLREDDFAKGKAFRVGDTVACRTCAPPERVKAFREATARGARVLATSSSAMLRTLPDGSASSAPGSPPLLSRKRLILGLAGAAILGVLGLALVLGRSRGGPIPPSEPSPAPARPLGPQAGTPPGASPAAPSPSLTPAERALGEARRFAQTHSGDLPGQIREFNRIVWDFDGTPSAAEAKKEIVQIHARLRESLAPQLAALEGEIKGPIEREEFAGAVRILDEAKPRLDLPEWTQAITRRREEVTRQVRALYPEVESKALQAQSANAPAEVAALRKRVEKWGMEFYVKAFEDAVGPDRSPAPEGAGGLPREAVRTVEGKAYLVRWEAALAKATARDYASAALELARAKGDLKEEASLQEFAQDTEDLRQAGALLKECQDAALLRTVGNSLSVATQDGKKASGRILYRDADRVEILGHPRKPSTFAEWCRVTPGSLLGLCSPAKILPRPAAILCLMEGDLEGAQKVLGDKTDSVPAKYWSYAETAKSKLPAVDPAEKAAQETFYDAEREWRVMATRGPAVEKYKQLRTDYARTLLVTKLELRIAARSEAPKEYFFAPADYQCSGTLQMTKAGRLESRKDTDGAVVLENYAELEFYAFPGTLYRGWVLVGGCCQEVLEFYWQGTEMTDYKPKSTQKVPVEPGSNLGIPAKLPSVRGLKAKHDPKEPKRAARWEWVEIPLPKYASAGGKRVRLFTDQGGFSVGPAVVSATRPKPPSDSELKELEAHRAEEAPLAVVDPDLVGHWRLDEGEGTQALDSSGNGLHGAISSGAAWIEGRIGGALSFDGVATAVSVPDADLLRIPGDITIAFWVNKRTSGGDYQRLVGKGDERIRNYGVWTGGSEGNRILWQQYDSQAKVVLNVAGQRSLPIGTWAHVAAVVKGSRASLYMDGRPDGQAERTGTPGVSSAPLTLGFGVMHAYFAGALDDVRVYRRALTLQEIQALSSAGR
jgi:hypothetical protein